MRVSKIQNRMTTALKIKKAVVVVAISLKHKDLCGQAIVLISVLN